MIKSPERNAPDFFVPGMGNNLYFLPVRVIVQVSISYRRMDL